MVQRHWRVVLLAGLATLAACGGGGGGGSGDGGNPVVPAAAPINAANYQGVAQQTVAAALYMGDASGLITGAQVAPGAQVLMAFSRAQLRRLPGVFARARPVATGVTTTEVIECSGGGSISATLNDVNGNSEVDAGDSGRLMATNCRESGATINGGIVLTFNAVSGDIDSDIYAATVAVTLQELRASTDAGNVTGNGNFSLLVSSTSATASTLDVTATNLTMSGVFAGQADTITLQDYRVRSSTTVVAGRLRTSTSISGIVSSNTLATGALTVATVQPLLQFEGDSYPLSGQLTATGMGGSQVRLTVQNTSNVLVELDADGNGSFESSVVKAWSSLA